MYVLRTSNILPEPIDILFFYRSSNDFWTEGRYKFLFRCPPLLKVMFFSGKSEGNINKGRTEEKANIISLFEPTVVSLAQCALT